MSGLVESGASHLPFLYAHGPLVWKALLAVIIACGCWLLARSRRRAGAKPLGIAWWVTWIVFLGAAGGFVMRGIGMAALSIAEEKDGPWEDVASFDALAIAAAMPQFDDSPLKLLESRLGYVARNERTFQLHVETIEALGRCADGFLLRAQRYDEALAAAHRCGHTEAESEILALLGRFDEAAVLAREPGLVVTIAVLRGHWEDAAVVLEQWRRPCLAALMRTLSGDNSAFSKVTSKTTECELASAFAKPLEGARDVVIHAELSEKDTHMHIVRDRVAMLLGIHVRGYDWFNDLMFPSGDPGPWIATSAIRPSGMYVEHQAALRRRLVVAAMIRGDRARARDELAAATALGTSHSSETLAAELALFDATLPVPQIYRSSPIAPAVQARAYGVMNGEPYASEWGGAFCRLAYAGGISSAWRGEGADLAWVLAHCPHPSATRVWELLAVLPRVTNHRADLRAAIRLVRDDSVMASRNLPFGVLETAARTRELSRAIGDTEEVGRMQDLIDRHVAALSDPKVVAALVFLEDWTLRD